jgi:glycosyltransferase involved in cell wall biosynthesis
MNPSSPHRPAVLMFGYLPPPWFGPSVSYQALMRSSFTQHCDVTFIDITVARQVQDLERFRAGKLVCLLKFVALELVHLLRKHHDFCCYPISYNRNAFLKDWLLISVARFVRVPVVLYAHGRGLPAFRRRLSARLARRLDAMIRSAAGVVVIAADIAAEFDDLVAVEKVFVVTHGIQPVELPPATGKTGFAILYLGVLTRSKGVFELLEAMAQVHRRHPQARLILAGGWFREAERIEAQALIDRMGLEAAVQFTGPVEGEAKWRLFAQADVFVFVPEPQLEAFGMVLLEAMQAGLPIVASRGGARDVLVSEGVNGLLVPAGDVAALAERLLQLAADPAGRRRLGEAGRKRFEDNYTHEHYGQRMSHVFRALDEHASKQNPRIS